MHLLSRLLTLLSVQCATISGHLPNVIRMTRTLLRNTSLYYLPDVYFFLFRSLKKKIVFRVLLHNGFSPFAVLDMIKKLLWETGGVGLIFNCKKRVSNDVAKICVLSVYCLEKDSDIHRRST